MIRRFFLALTLAALSLSASAFDLTTPQRATLKSAVEADATLNGHRLSGNYDAILGFYNAPAAPEFVVWRTDVTSDEIGNAWVGTDIDTMSALNMQRLQLLLASSPAGTFDMSRADRRAGFEGPFGTNANNASRVAMRAAWKRPATALEKLYAVGTGSTATPAVFGAGADGKPIEGPLQLLTLVNLWR